jgi:transposase
MMGKKDFKPRIFYRLCLEKMVPQDHLVRALEEILDMNFIRGLCRKYYSHTGQPSVDPVVLFKMMLIGYLFGITSERKLAEESTVNLAFRWYLGYDLDEATPNHSVISKARGRFGKKVFEEFFQEVLSICIKKGLVTGEKIFADGTLIKANASLKSLVARSDAPSPSLSPNEYVEKVFQENSTKSENNSERNDDPRITRIQFSVLIFLVNLFVVASASFMVSFS